MKILITGGAGFIGSHLVDQYQKENFEVVAVDNLSTGSKDNLNPKAKFIQADITTNNIKKIILSQQPDIINHHAAQINVRASVQDPVQDANTNIVGSINLLEAAKASKSVKKIIFASTGGAIYGDANITPTPESYPAWPISPYGISKLAVEHYLHYYRQMQQISFVSLRYGNVYGPRQNPHGEAGVVSIFYNQVKQGKEFTINGDGNQTRDFVFVADVVKANLLVTKDSRVTGIFNIGTGHETSINQLTRAMVATLPQAPKINHGPNKTGEQQTSCLDCSKAKKKLNWHPQFSLAKGLEQTARFFID